MSQVHEVLWLDRMQCTDKFVGNSATSCTWACEFSWDACRQLYHVLQCQAHAASRRSRVVIACNKVDLEERAFSQDFIVKQLEKEMCAPLLC